MTYKEAQNKLEELEVLIQSGCDYIFAETQARELLPKLASLDKRHANELHCRTLIVLSESLFQRGMAGDSLPFAVEALALAKQGESNYILGKAFGNIGLVHSLLSNNSEALEYLNQAHSLFEEQGSKGGMASIACIIGNVHYMLAKYSQASERYNHALALHEELGNKRGIAACTGNIGNVCLCMDDYRNALTHMHSSLALYKELGMKAEMGRMSTNIGSVYRAISSYKQSLEHYHSALTVLEEVGVNNEIAVALGNIGIVYRLLKDYPRAIDYLEQAVAISQKIGSRGSMGMFVGNIGIAYQEMNDFPNAMKHLEKALEIYSAMDARLETAQFMGNVGEVHRKTGNYDRALEYFNQTYTVFEELGRLEEAAAMLEHKGLVYAEPRFSGYNPALAEEYLLESIARYESLGTKQHLYRTYCEISNFYELHNRLDESLSCFKKYHDLYAEVQSEEVKKQADRYGWERQLAELEQEQQIERLHHDHEKRMMQQRIELQTRDVETTIRELVAKNNLLHEILLDAKRLADFTRGNGVEILEKMTNRLTRNTMKISSSADPNKEWAEENTAFVSLLHKKYPDLSGMELKVCALLRMKMTTLNICSALFLSRRTVESHRLSIRKKLGLSKEQDLNTAMGNMAE